MRKLFLSLVILVSIGATAQKLKPVTIGIDKVADSISVSVITFKTTDKSCSLYYEIFNEGKVKIDDGNLQLSETEFAQWGETNRYIEDLALKKLKLERKATVSKLTGSIALPIGFQDYKVVSNPNYVLTPAIQTQELVLTRK